MDSISSQPHPLFRNAEKKQWKKRIDQYEHEKQMPGYKWSVIPCVIAMGMFTNICVKIKSIDMNMNINNCLLP